MSSDDRGLRLHPSSLFFGVLTSARNFLVPAIVVIVFAQGDRWQAWLGLGFVLAFARELLRYFTLRYRFDPDELVVREGLLFRSERHVPYGRIQNVDLVQNPLHRLFRVAEVRLETGSGSKPEAVLKVLKLAAVDDIRRRVHRGAPAGSEPADAQADAPAAARDGGRTLLRLSPGELIKLGLISNRAAPLLAVLLGLAWEFDLWDRIPFGEEQLARIEALDTWTNIALAVGGAVALTVLYLILSMVWTLIWLYGFRLTRSDDEFRLECGLLTRISATIPLRRIQIVAVDQSPLQRLMRRVSVRIATAGGGPESDARQSVRRRWFIPLLPENELPRILHELAPGVDLDALPWTPLAPRARRRLSIRWLIRLFVILAPVTTVGLALEQSELEWIAAVAAAMLVPFAWWHARYRARFDAFAWTEHHAVARSGVWPRSWRITTAERIQVVQTTQSPFDRRHDMATVCVDTAGTGLAHRIRIAMLPRASAEHARRTLIAQAVRTRYRW